MDSCGDTDVLTILNILFHQPEDMEWEGKPSGIRDNKVFTLNRRKISIESAKADDNGAYVLQGTAKRSYYYSVEDKQYSGRIVHEENSTFYINIRNKKNYEKKYVSINDVYEITRIYRKNKDNPTFSQILISVRQQKEVEVSDY